MGEYLKEKGLVLNTSFLVPLSEEGRNLLKGCYNNTYKILQMN